MSTDQKDFEALKQWIKENLKVQVSTSSGYYGGFNIEISLIFDKEVISKDTSYHYIGD